MEPVNLQERLNHVVLDLSSRLELVTTEQTINVINMKLYRIPLACYVIVQVITCQYFPYKHRFFEKIFSSLSAKSFAYNLTTLLECEKNTEKSFNKTTGDMCGNHEPCYCAGNICIVGGNCNSGNAFIRGKPVCDDGWGVKDATAFCKTIGYAGAKSSTKIF